MMQSVGNLEDQEAQQLWNNINEIVRMSDVLAQDGVAHAHVIYRLARDCRHLITFDRVSRETVKALAGEVRVNGLVLSNTVQDLARNNKIAAIRQLRMDTGCGLREAKDAVESFLGEPQW